MDNPDIGNFGYLWHSTIGGPHIISSPNAVLIQNIYAYNAINYYPDDKRNTKFEFSDLQWNDIASADFSEISNSIVFPDNYGNGINDVNLSDIIKFQTQDSIIGFMQIIDFSRVSATIFLNVKILDENADINETTTIDVSL